MIQLIKRIYAFILVISFFSSAVLVVVFLYPVFVILDKIKEPNPSRMQGVNRFLYSVLLWFLQIGRLIKIKSIKGQCYNKSCIIIANHPGLLDIVYLIAIIPEMSVMVKNELASKLALRHIIRSAGYVLSPGKGYENFFSTSREALKIIKEGYKFMLFPEGTRSPEGKLHHFYAGAFKLAQKANVPVQPVIIRNTPSFLPKGVPWYHVCKERSEVVIEFLDLIDPPEKGQERQLAKEIENMYIEKLFIS